MSFPGPAPHAGRTAGIILAAGLGTRMKSRVPKILHRICGRPMIDYVIDAWDIASTADGQPSQPIIVISFAADLVKDSLGTRVRYALQEVPRGTGDAVAAALGELEEDVDEIIVLSGDVPLVTSDHVGALMEQRRLDDAAVTLASVDAVDPGQLGRVVRGEFGTVEAIVEAKDATTDQLETNEVNAGLYVFDARWLRRRLPAIVPSPVSGELYLTDLVKLAREDGRIVSAVQFEDDGTFDGINDRAQLARAEWGMRVRINERHLRNGVTMRDPSTVYLDWYVELAQDVTIEPNVVMRGRTTVGEGTTIGPGGTIVESKIGRECRIWESVVERSTVEDEVMVGPFSHIRPGSHVGRGAEIGNYAEIKNSTLGEGVKQHHMSYLGDAVLGEGTNVGAGTITANWDGSVKNRTTIGERVFLGVDTMLVAPVTIGDEAKTGAGAVVTHDVPARKLAVGVPARIREPRRRPDPDRDRG